ncbi:MAG: ribonuclease III [Epulopiscium sp.]|nr:ribonuclease III [Candidatus Epulonipiscium sp.]
MENDSNVQKILEGAHQSIEIKNIKPREYSPLVLAYIGDAVFELFIRTEIISRGNAPVNKLHQAVREYVKASAQANIYNKIKDYLTEEEEAIFKRGRNAKSSSVPKNADLLDYKHATGLEALCGYLYLDGQIDRLRYLINLAIEEQKVEE